MLWLVRDLADRQGVPRDRLLAMYADTGMEWHNAEEHVKALCMAAGVALATVYPVRPMLETFKMRMKIPQFIPFPYTKCRFCTTYHKKNSVGQADKAFFRQAPESYRGTLGRIESSQYLY